MSRETFATTRLRGAPSTPTWLALACALAAGCGDSTELAPLDAPLDAGAEAAIDAPADAAADALADTSADASLDAPEDASVDSAVDAVADVGLDGLHDAEPVDGSACGAVVQEQPYEGATHVPTCSTVSYASNPPSSGNHYPIWAAFRSYDAPVPEGFLVHDLEHGAIVLTYNCPTGCAGEVAAAQAFIDALPVDPLCPEAGPARRVVMTPDPRLTTKWAASAWTWTLRAGCFEASSFGAFVAAHYAHAPEDECADGVDLAVDGGAWCEPADAASD